MLAVDWPCGMVMLEGTVTADVLLSPSVTTSPLVLVTAGVTVTVSVPGPDVKVNVLGDSASELDEAVMVTVAGALLRNPSFTISCTTYIPATSATKLGETVVGAVSFAVLPVGTLSSDQL